MKENLLSLYFYPLLFIGVFVFIIFAIKKSLQDEAAFKVWVESAGYTYIGPEPQTNLRDYFKNRMHAQPVPSPDGMTASSYHKGDVYRGLSGELPMAHNKFSVVHQTETRGSGKNKRVYSRTIASVRIPDTRLQLIINSKVNNDIVSGGNLTHYSTLQRFSLEGNFGTYFEVYMPESTQSEALTLLAPDVMHFIMTNLGEFDIEINGQQLFLYTYRHLPPEELQALLNKLDKLLEEFELREGDSRTHKTAYVPVAHTITNVPVSHRSLKRSHLSVLTVMVIVVLIAIALLVPSLVMYKAIDNSGSGVSLTALLFLIVGFSGIFWAVIHMIRQILSRERLKQRYAKEIQRYQGTKQ